MSDPERVFARILGDQPRDDRERLEWAIDDHAAAVMAAMQHGPAGALIAHAKTVLLAAIDGYVRVAGVPVPAEPVEEMASLPSDQTLALFDGLEDHFAEPTPSSGDEGVTRARGTCLVCGRDVQLRADGTTRMHYPPVPDPVRPSARCAGSGQHPEEKPQ
jgi:hypothetical protein